MKVSGKTSTNTGFAPRRVITSAVEIQVYGTVITSSPDPMSRAIRDIKRASVPLEQVIQCSTPTKEASLSSWIYRITVNKSINRYKRIKRQSVQEDMESFVYKNNKGILYAERKEQFETYSLIEFSWEPQNLSFSEILIYSGIIPLPPYMNRKAVELDKYRYQTIYANSEGSVAAPTAGLHFTDDVLARLKKKNISINEVTLHVGAGTFKPVSTPNISEHEMHTEKILIRKSTIQNILDKLSGDIIVTGTTTMRTIESLYWFGVKLIIDKNQVTTIDIKQWDPYNINYNKDVPVEESLNAVLELMNKTDIEVISGQTQLMIAPGYKYKIPNILITNFHMPQSTLLLLVSAFIGESWKDAYKYALDHNFRFLSYGDSCLFFRS